MVVAADLAILAQIGSGVTGNYVWDVWRSRLRQSPSTFFTVARQRQARPTGPKRAYRQLEQPAFSDADFPLEITL
jgi:hypothetical protein